MAEDFTIDRFVDALGQLPEYGGHEALAGGLREAYPSATFLPASGGNDYSGGIQAHDWDSRFSTPGAPAFLGQAFRLNNTALQRSAQPNFLSAYEAMWPTLSGLVNPSTSPALTGSMLSGGSSPAGGAITTTAGGILGTDPFMPPASTSLTNPMPSQEEVNNAGYRDWVNQLVNVDTSAGGKDIFGDGVEYGKMPSPSSDSIEINTSLTDKSVDELLAAATGEQQNVIAGDAPTAQEWERMFPEAYAINPEAFRTPYTSQVPNSANKYLQEGPNAFAYSGEGGYAAERQRMLGRDPDIYQGPEVPWQRLGKDAPSDVYYGNQRFNAPTGEVADVGGGEEFDWNAWRKGEIIRDIPEGAFHPGNDNWGHNVNKHYGDLETAKREKLMGDAEKYWADDVGRGLYKDFPEDTKDFRFFEHEGVNKNVTEWL